MKIRLLGAHNSESSENRPASLLIDNILACDAGGFTNSLSFHEQIGVKAILITHPHYDHIKDVPMLGMTFHIKNKKIEIFGNAEVLRALEYIMNGELHLYKNWLHHPPEDPIIKFTVVEPLKEFEINGYKILPVPVKHSVPAMGFQITSASGKSVFYTGDTGEGLEEAWSHVHPDVLIIETTAEDQYRTGASESHHLTPHSLKLELEKFKKIHGYIPKVVTIHMFPHDPERWAIVGQLKKVAAELEADIEPGYENMQIHL